ncbi:MAG: PadR family transcriptional regulator [Candidatus Saccharimonadales bacterium]|jgi:DNA-binding PadR family transcriptional regulator
MKLTPFESTMLSGWEDVYRKSQVSLWILIAIREEKGFVEEIRTFIHRHGDVDMSEQSLYRSLRRLESATLIQSRSVENPKGPDRKYFSLSPEGGHVLGAFIERNITAMFLSSPNNDLFSNRKDVS